METSAVWAVVDRKLEELIERYMREGDGELEPQHSNPVQARFWVGICIRLRDQMSPTMFEEFTDIDEPEAALIGASVAGEIGAMRESKHGLAIGLYHLDKLAEYVEAKLKPLIDHYVRERAGDLVVDETETEEDESG